ncbi:MAG: hypothetical protein JWN80_1152 [Microbacteriaceae bacterium]|jgi:hypothetical protein|nr:hypothetical protein [Microbacteriaceae bacterium]
MPADGIGSSVIIAVAAVLWLAYLVPSWLRRREYLSTERNALRLQQTLRVMAESGEMPQVIHAENLARAAVQQEQVLRKRQQREAAIEKAQVRARDAALERAAERRLAEVQVEALPGTLAAGRLRRSRAMTSVVLLASLVAGGFGVNLLVASGEWLLLASSTVVALGSFVMLGQMAGVSRARAHAARGVSALASVAEPVEAPIRRVVRREPWTPVPVPKPLYLSRPQAARATDAELQAAAELRQAAADAERKLREAHEAPEVRPLRPAAVSRFASMGIVDPAATGTPDLDAALARRRA